MRPRYPLVKALRSAGPRTLLRDLPQELRFQLLAGERKAAAAGLRSMTSATDLFRFAQSQVHGGPSQREPEIIQFLEMLAERAPRTVVELGTGNGGTTMLFANAVPGVELVVGVSLFVTNRTRLLALRPPEVQLELIDGSSYEPPTVAAVTRALSERPIDVLFIDGDHTFAGALADFRAYRGLVAPGGVIAFHDIVPDLRLRSGTPSEAWSGEVPVVWDILRHQFQHREFIESWDQLGAGIGALVHDPLVEPRIVTDRGRPADVHVTPANIGRQ